MPVGGKVSAAVVCAAPACRRPEPRCAAAPRPRRMLVATARSRKQQAEELLLDEVEKWEPFVLKGGCKPWERFPIAACQLAVPDLAHEDYVAATFVIAAHKMGMPLDAFLKVGRHLWEPAAAAHSDSPLAPDFYSRGPQFYEQGAVEYCRTLLASGCPPRGLEHKELMQVLPVLELVASGCGLPKTRQLKRFAAAFAPHISISKAACGVVYVGVDSGIGLPTGAPAEITQEMLSSPKAIQAQFDKAYQLAHAAGEGAYVGSSAQACKSAGALRSDAERRHRGRHVGIVLSCATSSPELLVRMAEQYIVNRCGLERLANKAPLMYLHNLSGRLGRGGCERRL